MFHPIPVIFVLLFVRLRKCFVEVSLWWDHHPHIQTIPLKQPIRRPRYKENTKITRTSSAKTIWAKHRANKKQLKHQHFVLLMSWRYKPHSIFLWWNLSTTSGFFFMLHPKWQSFPGTIFRHQTRNNTFFAAIVYNAYKSTGSMLRQHFSKPTLSPTIIEVHRGWKCPRLNPRGERLDARRQSPKCGALRKGSSWNLPFFTWKKLESWAI